MVTFHPLDYAMSLLYFVIGQVLVPDGTGAS